MSKGRSRERRRKKREQEKLQRLQEGQPAEATIAEPKPPRSSRHDRTERTEFGLTKSKELQLERKAIARGWIDGKRWNIDLATEDLEQIQKQRPLSLREKVLLNTNRAADHKDLRMQRAAVKTVIQMESQNQKDEHKAIDQENQQTQSSSVVPLVRVVVGNRDEALRLESMRLSQLEALNSEQTGEDQTEEKGNNVDH